MALDQKMNSRAELFGTVFSANVSQKLLRLDPSRLPIILVIVLVSIPGFKIGSGPISSCAFIPWSSRFVLTCLVQFGCSLAAAVLYTVYNVYFHPLSKFPGPRWWAATRIPYTVNYLSGRCHLTMLDLHRRYGPIVRVSPGELAYCHPNAWKEIFDTRKKGAEWHDRDPAFFHSASHSISGATGYEQHVRHRQNISPVFAPQALVAQEPMFKQHVDVLIQCLRKECDAGRRTMDMASWYSWVTYDVVGELMFSENFDCLKTPTNRSWVTLIANSFRAGAWEAQLHYYPRPIAAVLRYFCMPAALQNKFVQHGELTVEKLSKRLETAAESSDIIGVLLRKKRDNEVCSVSHDTSRVLLPWIHT